MLTSARGEAGGRGSSVLTGGGVKKWQNLADVICERSHIIILPKYMAAV